MDVRWYGPGVITERVGEHSYKIEIGPGRNMEAHISQLKPWFEDEEVHPLTPLFTYQPEVEKLQVDEFEVDKILEYKRREDGTLWFLTLWKGYPESEATWEPTTSFIHRYSSDFSKFIRDHDITLDIRECLH
jgi:hypothetical protein